MKTKYWLCFAALLAASLLPGCSRAPSGKPSAAQKATETDSEEAGIADSLANLPPEDRQLAQEQKFCAVEHENRLGAMGTPVKVMLNDQPVFLCCKGCRKKALADPDRTLAAAKDLRVKAGGERAK